jgi:hypothetical protein
MEKWKDRAINRGIYRQKDREAGVAIDIDRSTSVASRVAIFQNPLRILRLNGHTTVHYPLS